MMKKRPSCTLLLLLLLLLVILGATSACERQEASSALDAMADQGTDRSTARDHTPDRADLAGHDQGATPDLKAPAAAHPRLLLRDFTAVSKRVGVKGSGPALLLQELQKKATTLLAKKTLAQELPNTGNIGRNVLDRVMTFTLLHHLSPTGPQAKTYLARARTELMAAVTGPLFPDWKHATQWLATAEITAAVALGYDWLYPHLDPAQRKAVRRALFDRSFAHYRRAYRCSNLGPAAAQDKECTKDKLAHWWVDSQSNWNAVSNASLILGLLAVEPELNAPDMSQADRALFKACNDAALVAVKTGEPSSLRLGLDDLAGGGGWSEGPAYWEYAMTYLSMALSSLKAARNTTAGLEKVPGLKETVSFHFWTQGVTGVPFNFSDCKTDLYPAPAALYLADLFNAPDAARLERRRMFDPRLLAKSRANKLALYLLWHRDLPSWKQAIQAGTSRQFKNVHLAVFRENFKTPPGDAIYFGFKGGVAPTPHRQMENGTFIFEADGVRWVEDTGYGSCSNNLTKYRCKNAGHNTLVIDGKVQNQSAVSPITHYKTPKDGTIWSVLDLKAAYLQKGGPSNLSRLLRGFYLDPASRVVLVKDAIRYQDSQCKQPSKPTHSVQWRLHTRAKVTTADISADGKEIQLSQGTRKAKLVVNTNLTKLPWKIEDAASLEPALAGVKVLTLTLQVNCGRDLELFWVPGTSKLHQKTAAQLVAWAKQTGKPFFNKPVWQW